MAESGSLEEAIASYDKAIEFKPDDHEAWFNRGGPLMRLGRWKEGNESIQRAIDIKPEHYTLKWFIQTIVSSIKKRLQQFLHKPFNRR